MPTSTAPTETPLLAPHQVILRPLVTEKGMHRSSRQNAYAFEVSKAATKLDVRRAVEDLFNVKVLRVHIQNRKGKPRRTRFRSGATADWKKAIVKVHAEQRIDFF
jgi:large subunit ribosomal protein L23